MSRLVLRLAIPGIILAIGWVGYQLADVTDCSGPRSDEWASATMARLDAAETDYNSWNEAATSYQFTSLAGRAEQRYRAQLGQAHPSCLVELQNTTAEFFFSEWKMYEAAGSGDFETAARYDEDSVQAMEASQREIDTLAVKFDWDIE